MEIKTYVEFLYPGSFFSESSSLEVKDRDTINLKIPELAFCFYFYDVKEQEITTDWGEIQTLKSKMENVSGKYYIDGEVLTYEDVVKLDSGSSQYRILLCNMKTNSILRVVLCRTGNIQPFEDSDLLFSTAITKEQLLVED